MNKIQILWHKINASFGNDKSRVKLANHFESRLKFATNEANEAYELFKELDGYIKSDLRVVFEYEQEYYRLKWIKELIQMEYNKYAK